jgi:hypothetical protein
MNPHKDSVDDRNLKSRSKFRKAGKHRNSSIINKAFKAHSSSLKDPSTLHSRNSVILDSSAEVEGLRLKVSNLSEEKDQLMEVLNSKENEYLFLNQIISQFIDINELLKIRQGSSFDESKNIWVLPQFQVKHKKTLFPKLQRSQFTENKDFQINISKKNGKVEDGEVCRSENRFFDQECSREGQGRPCTSISKHRQTSMDVRQHELKDNLRRSPVLRYAKYEL